MQAGAEAEGEHTVHRGVENAHVEVENLAEEEHAVEQGGFRRIRQPVGQQRPEDEQPKQRVQKPVLRDRGAPEEQHVGKGRGIVDAGGKAVDRDVQAGEEQVRDAERKQLVPQKGEPSFSFPAAGQRVDKAGQ